MKEEIIQVSNEESDFLFKKFKALKFDCSSSSRRSPPTEAIPLTFARKYLPDEKTRMRLMNKDGDSWDVNFIPSEGRPVFCGGWTASVWENGLKRCDICVFELVQEFVMKLYIRKPE